MNDLPAPLTPPDCDLRDYTFMPLDIVRLFGSEFHAQSNDAEWRAGVTLWCKSFHQMPAASLPDDDVTLCRLAELGRDLKTWTKLRNGALRGWVKCADGRLYHPVVAEKACDAWDKKKKQRDRSRKGNEARWGKDNNNSPDGKQELSHKDSLKDSPSDPSTIPRDRDRDRDNTLTSFETRADATDPDARSDADRKTDALFGTDRSSKPEKFTLPAWVPADPWNGFLEMRRKIKKPMTDYAVKRMIEKLDGMRSRGEDPAAVLDQSVRGSWSDVYPLKAGTSGSGQQSERARRLAGYENIPEIEGI